MSEKLDVLTQLSFLKHSVFHFQSDQEAIVCGLAFFEFFSEG